MSLIEPPHSQPISGAYRYPGKPASSRRRRRHKRPSSSSRGRAYLLVIFSVLLLISVAAYLSVPNIVLPDIGNVKFPILATIVTSFLCYGVLLVGIWHHHDWTRTILVALLFTSSLVECFVIPIAFGDIPDLKDGTFTALYFIPLSQFIAAILVIGLRDVKRLVSRAYE